MTKYVGDVFLAAATQEFLLRNEAVLAEVQLQFAKAELWFAREFSLAMNRVMNGARRTGFTETGFEYADISVWETSNSRDPSPQAFFEVKAINSTREKNLWRAIGAKAWGQTRAPPPGSALHGITGHGLFYFVLEEKTEALSQARQDDFLAEVRAAIGFSFSLSKGICLLPPTRLVFGDSAWSTSSWVAWGAPLP